MIWIKRILPFVIIAGLFFGYHFYNKSQLERKDKREKEYALITAQAWIATIKYREAPELYLAYRDSLLESYNLSADSLKLFVESYESNAEDLLQLSSRIKNNVDSILHVQDSLKRIADSLVQIDTTL